jgi:hypothetical protein
LKVAILHKRAPYLALLTVIFLVSFSLPVVFALWQGGVQIWEDDDELLVSHKLIPNPFRVQGPNVFFKVKNHQVLDPEPGRDFLLLGWFSIKRLPPAGKKAILLAKYDNAPHAAKGYALGLLRDADAVRPVVYWNNAERKGGWYVFSELDIAPHSWFMFALSFRNDRLLGLHYALYLDGNEGQQKLLGGYDLEKALVPASNADLMLGSFRTTWLRGLVGGVGIFHRKNLSDDLDQLLDEIIADPLATPDLFKKDEVKLWTIDGVTDHSPFHHKIVSSKKHGKARKARKRK